MAIWCGTLRSDDIQQTTAELKSQRAAIRARYDYEMKQLETKIGDLEMLEDSVLNFVSNYKVEDGDFGNRRGPGTGGGNRHRPRADGGKGCRSDRERAEQLDELADL